MKNIHLILLLLIPLCFISCGKDAADNNNAPFCSITSVEEGQEVQKGEVLEILIEACDEDGTIVEVGLSLDGFRLNYSEYPEPYQLVSYYLQCGEHEIRAIAIDDDQTIGSDECTIYISDDGSYNMSVATREIVNVGHNTATSGGYFPQAGYLPVIAKGVCWSATANPALTDPHTNEGEGAEVFMSLITGLEPGEGYYVKAYAINAEDTLFGNQRIFTTHSLPAVTTRSVINITPFSAESGGEEIDNGGGQIVQKGICWGLTNPPEITDECTFQGMNETDFVSQMTGLTPNTTYYVRAYVRTGTLIAYGQSIEFSTPEE